MEETIAKVVTEQGVEGLGRYYSIYRGFVTKNVDPYGKNRIKVFVPDVNGIRLWALPKGQHGSEDTGFKYLTPPIGEVVWVEFEMGDLSKPVWSYYSWAEGEIPKELDHPNIMGFKTPNGTVVLLDDNDGHLDVYLKGSASIYSEDNVDIYSAKSVRINAGNNGGVINIEQLTNKLNDLVTELEQLKATFNSHTHTGVTPGGGTSLTPTTLHTGNFNMFNQSDYEDTKFTH